MAGTLRQNLETAVSLPTCVCCLLAELPGRDAGGGDEVVLRVHVRLDVAQEGPVGDGLQHRPPLRAHRHGQHVHLLALHRVANPLHQVLHAARVLPDHRLHLRLQLLDVPEQRAALPLHQRRRLQAQNVGRLHERRLVKPLHVLLQRRFPLHALGHRRVGGRRVGHLLLARGVEQPLQPLQRLLVYRGARLCGHLVLQRPKLLLQLEPLVHAADEIAKHDGRRVHLRHLQLAHLHRRVAVRGRGGPHHGLQVLLHHLQRLPAVDAVRERLQISALHVHHPIHARQHRHLQRHKLLQHAQVHQVLQHVAVLLRLHLVHAAV
mmetsp:Transcript_20416/g.36407  ORF Transcript_20416/g.36407 Transcript_20416/m.36407 type:complete len:320 (-) Transcript_20416:557-1516(-)